MSSDILLFVAFLSDMLSLAACLTTIIVVRKYRRLSTVQSRRGGSEISPVSIATNQPTGLRLVPGKDIPPTTTGDTKSTSELGDPFLRPAIPPIPLWLLRASRRG